ncbi:MAG TPA: hypothetical protein VE983_11115 [Solirubrobacteraceae bacterium]|nr:hypothetical protein [Solirubrobacteraceae bacterium]
MNRPLLLVDVDGVISLFGFDPKRPPDGKFQIVDGIAHFLSATAGPLLRELSRWFEPAWCTGWEEKANDYLPHALELPGPWPYLSFDGVATWGSCHWKLGAIDRYAGGSRPVAWIDDNHDERTRAWAQGRPAPTLLVETDPATGLTEAHVGELLAWARSQAAVRACTGGSSDATVDQVSPASGEANSWPVVDPK